MNVKTILWMCCAALGLASTAAAENARLPYHHLYRIQKAQAELNRAHTNLVVVLTMQSTVPEVKKSDLAVFIEARAGKIPVEISPEGTFSVPMRDDLLAEDPWIVVNQPSGTMKLNWRVGIILGRLTNSMPYARLLGPVRENEEVQTQMRQFFPNAPKLVMTGLRLTFPASTNKAMVVIHARDGDRRMEPNVQGELVLPLIADLLQENPPMTLPVLPGLVEIVSHPSSE